MIEDPRLQSFRIFNENGGKFRVAVTNVCNLDCFFCHNEGMPNPRGRRGGGDEENRRGHRGRGEEEDDNLSSPRPSRPLRFSSSPLPPGSLLGIINAWTRLGGRQVNVTGGEPLAHPEIVPFLEGIEKRESIIVLNTNAVLADRLLSRPKIANLDQIFASLHTTNDESFRRDLGGRSIGRVMENIAALRAHGYDVQINFSLGPYNRDEFAGVLDFAIRHSIKLKAIALVRPNEEPEFYGGRWVDPDWLRAALEARGALEIETKDAFGGRTTSYRVAGTMVKVKNVALGRLETDFCLGCPHRNACGEGIYGIRVGVDGVWKPCLLRNDRFRAVDERPWEDQILDIVDAMIGRWDRARFRSGAPA